MLPISPEKQDSGGCFSPEERRFVLNQFTGFVHASLSKQGCYDQFLVPVLCEMVTPRYRYTVDYFGTLIACGASFSLGATWSLCAFI